MSPPTAVTVLVPGPLRAACRGAAELPATGETVRAVLDHLERDHPALYRSICDETGAVRRHIGVFVNTSHIRDRDGLDTVLAAGDAVIILPAVSGG